MSSFSPRHVTACRTLTSHSTSYISKQIYTPFLWTGDMCLLSSSRIALQISLVPAYSGMVLISTKRQHDLLNLAVHGA